MSSGWPHSVKGIAARCCCVHSADALGRIAALPSHRLCLLLIVRLLVLVLLLGHLADVTGLLLRVCLTVAVQGRNLGLTLRSTHH